VLQEYGIDGLREVIRGGRRAVGEAHVAYTQKKLAAKTG